jgi:phosphoribosylformimino-5-aminoimidazole carboxamide ribotide isomerase
MRVIPVLDLERGRAVHARRGERAAYAPVESTLAPGRRGDARAVARAYVHTLGARELYVADLDAITGGALQHDLLHDLAALGAPLWVDAGVATAEQARRATSAGAHRVIVGLETLPSFEALDAIAGAVAGAGVAFSLDLHAGVPIVRADACMGGTAESLAERAVQAGARAVIVLDLARVGASAGVDLPLLERIRCAVPGVELVAGGGVRDGEDLRRLADAGCDAALVATALHAGRITRAEMEVARHRG